MDIHTKPYIQFLTDKNYEKILEIGYPSLVVILPQKADTILTANITNILLRLNKQYRGKLRFYVSYHDDEASKTLMREYFNFQVHDLPTYLIFDGVNNDFTTDLKKFHVKNGTELNENNILKFVNDFLDNKLEFEVTSEEIPKSQLDSNKIHYVVGKTFDNHIKKNHGKDIIFLLCEIEQKDCKTVFERYTNAAKKLNQNNIVFSFMNPFKNEVESVQIHKVPSILLFRDKKNPHRKIKNPFIYEGSFSTKDITRFVKENMKNKLLNEVNLGNEDAIYRNELKVMISQTEVQSDDSFKNLSEMENSEEYSDILNKFKEATEKANEESEDNEDNEGYEEDSDQKESSNEGKKTDL